MKNEKWCPGADLNHRHADFQSAALPTELPGPLRSLAVRTARRKVPQGRPPGKALAYRKSAAACRVPDACRKGQESGRVMLDGSVPTSLRPGSNGCVQGLR